MLLATRKRNTSPHEKKGVFVFSLNFGNFWRVGRGWSHLFGIRRVSLQSKRTPTEEAGMEMWQSKPGQKRAIVCAHIKHQHDAERSSPEPACVPAQWKLTTDAFRPQRAA